MGESNEKKDKADVVKSGMTFSSGYISPDLVERYVSADEDTGRKAIVKEVYDRLSADVDAELEMLSSFGSDMEKVYKEAAQDIDRFVGRLIQEASTE